LTKDQFKTADFVVLPLRRWSS